MRPRAGERAGSFLTQVYFVYTPGHFLFNKIMEKSYAAADACLPLPIQRDDTRFNRESRSFLRMRPRGPAHSCARTSAVRLSALSSPRRSGSSRMAQVQGVSLVSEPQPSCPRQCPVTGRAPAFPKSPGFSDARVLSTPCGSP